MSILAALSLWSSVGRAEGPDQPMEDAVRGYYAYERRTAYSFVGLGVVSAAAGGVLVTRDGDFARGMGWSVLTLGVLQAIGAGAYKFQVDSLEERYVTKLRGNPAGFQRDEAEHIHGTTSRFVAYRLTELGLAVAGAGVATYGFVSHRDLWKGAGIGVAIEALTFFTIDSFGTLKAHEYQGQVERFSPSVGLQVGGSGRPWFATVGGGF